MRRNLLGLLGVVLLTVSLAAPSANADTTTVTPKITLVAADDLTYDRQTTTVTGTVTELMPDGTTGGPLAGLPVQILCSNACTGDTVTTDEAGHFTVPVTARWWQMSVSASIHATETVASAEAQLDLFPHSDVRITASADSSVVSAASPTSTFSGRLEYLSDDHSWKPLPDRKIQISQPGPPSVSATTTTSADGSFSKTVTLSPSSVTQQVSVLWRPATTEDTTFFKSPMVFVDIHPGFSPAIGRLSGSLSSSGTVSLAGTVTGATLRVPVTIEYSRDGSTGWTDVTTVETLGTFTSKFTAPAVPAYYRAEIVAHGYDGAISGFVKLDKTVTSISAFGVTVDPAGTLNVRANVSPSNLTVPVRIEYSADGKTGWKTAKSGTVTGGFSTSLKAPLAMAYYRAEIVAAPYYKGSTSRVLKVGRAPTRITGLKVSTTRVKKGSYFTITGVLQKYSSGWKALTGQRVSIVYHVKGGTALHLYGSVLTGTGGRFTAKIKATREAYWMPRYPGGTAYYATSPSTYIHVALR
ncbi:hypothetical protein Pth03_07590 [Planotetraspora thailandica]|uniref:Carboxypeptidase regulatory-like domain-containing protein n=1 Tax=Planotetraspora thailandica TaxID=487172 RepID=A0A8J3XTQ6_9ACTN|nr:hypothetical protein [Planotetraspora thailandica]GII52370.1 hypothetical protein Pth03_07590 [Planotetraspora thailandica]